MRIAVTITQGYVIEVNEEELDTITRKVYDNNFEDLQERLDCNPTHFEGQVDILDGMNPSKQEK